jgi:hypothetical protein
MDFELNLGDEEGFCLNLPEIVRSRTMLAPIRLLAVEMQEKPYMSVGEWISGLDAVSFNQLFELADCDEDDETMMEQLLLLTMMLSSAEGTSVNGANMEELATQLSMLRQLIVFTSLEKKGLVRCYFENFTLGTDMGDKTIVEKL